MVVKTPEEMEIRKNGVERALEKLRERFPGLPDDDSRILNFEEQRTFVAQCPRCGGHMTASEVEPHLTEHVSDKARSLLRTLLQARPERTEEAVDAYLKMRR